MRVATGDRPEEFPAFGVDWFKRDEPFRENLSVIRKAWDEEFPRFQSSYGVMVGTVDLMPKPIDKIPILVTGSSQQSIEWIASNADGWITYPRPIERQAEVVARWRAAVAQSAPGTFKPFA